jgi:hypothetical protein
MSSTFNFYGQTTFIDKPKDTVIREFQNTYMAGGDAHSRQINEQILQLIEVILKSKQLPAPQKNAAVQQLHTVAAEVKDNNVDKGKAKGILESIKDIVTKTADMVTPGIAIVKTILAFFA